MTKEDLLKLGFKELPYKTIGNILNYELSRNRHLSISFVGTPNEMLYLCATDNVNNENEITDLICLHNYDYDGYITSEKIQKIINLF